MVSKKCSFALKPSRFNSAMLELMEEIAPADCFSNETTAVSDDEKVLVILV